MLPKKRWCAARSQMRPVLMMIVVALLGMVPAARATAGSDVQRPLRHGCRGRVAVDAGPDADRPAGSLYTIIAGRQGENGNDWRA